MRPLERVPAVRRIETDGDDVFAVEITGTFMAPDAENLRGLLEGEYALHERIDLLLRVAALEEIDISGLSPETAAFLRDHFTGRVGRCALVGEAGALSGLLPAANEVELRRFGADEEDEAWAWIGARPIPQDV